MVAKMKVIFLHGAPARGKLTVANALLKVLPGRLFDNHAAIGFAQTIFDFGAPGFWDLEHNAWLLALEAASQRGVPLVVTTFCYSEPEDRSQFERIEAVVQRRGGELLPVFLHCSEAEVARRIGNADRAERGKITSMVDLNRSGNYHDAPVPRDNCMMMDTGATSAEATAHEIIRHFGLAS
jgi:hypothetical protein